MESTTRKRSFREPRATDWPGVLPATVPKRTTKPEMFVWMIAGVSAECPPLKLLSKVCMQVPDLPDASLLTFVQRYDFFRVVLPGLQFTTRKVQKLHEQLPLKGR